MTILVYATRVLGDAHLHVVINGEEKVNVRLTKPMMLAMMEEFVGALQHYESVPPRAQESYDPMTGYLKNAPSM